MNEAGLAVALGLGQKWQRAFARVEELAGGTVVAAERQERWRPAWFLEVARGDERVPIYFRGDRGLGEGGVYRLEHEYGVLKVLEAHGIPVPHVYGFCEDPRGIVMERSPGRENLGTAESEAERCAVLDHYVEILVEMHRIPVAAFEAIGLQRPPPGRAGALVDLPIWEKGYRRAKSRPEPQIEFTLEWLRRHAPAESSRVSFLTGDCGQFLFEKSRVTAALDLELATLGDPLADLGAMRCRDTSEPLGDLSRALRRYGELTGEAVDLAVVHFHTARFALCTPLAVAPLCAQPPPGFNLAQYLGWNLVFGRLALEAVAELQGLALVPPEIPRPKATRHAAAYENLLSLLTATGGSYAADTALRTAQYLREVDRQGPRLEEQGLDDAGELLGKRPADSLEADSLLERLVVEAGEEQEVALLQYFYRRSLREEAMLRPAMRELTDRALQPIVL